MIRYISRIVEEKELAFVSEKSLENKKVQVIGYPERRQVFVNFYRDDELIEDINEFNWTDEIRQEFNNSFDKFYGKVFSEEYVEFLSCYFQKYLNYIKDPIIQYITIEVTSL